MNGRESSNILYCFFSSTHKNLPGWKQYIWQSTSIHYLLFAPGNREAYENRWLILRMRSENMLGKCFFFMYRDWLRQKYVFDVSYIFVIFPTQAWFASKTIFNEFSICMYDVTIPIRFSYQSIAYRNPKNKILPEIEHIQSFCFIFGSLIFHFSPPLCQLNCMSLGSVTLMIP